MDLSAWSVQYASAVGTSWVNKTNLTGSIAAKSFYLVKEAGSTSNGVPLPAENVVGVINLSAANGKVALVNNQTSLTGCADHLLRIARGR